jgi:hypothetical protein
MADISKIEENRLKTLKEIKDIEDKISRVTKLSGERKIALEAKLIDQKDKLNKKLDKQTAALGRINEISERINERSQTTASLYKDINSEIKASLSSFKALDIVTGSVSKSTSKFQTSFTAALDTANRMKDTKSLTALENMKNAFGELQEAASSGNLDEFNKKWNEGLSGDLLNDMRELPLEIQQLYGQALASFVEMQKGVQLNAGLTSDELDSYKELTKEADEMKSRFESVANQINAIRKRGTGLSLAVAGAVAGAGFFVEKLGEVNQKLGMSLTSMNEFTFSVGSLSFFFDDAAETASQLATELGSMNQAGFETQLSTNLLAKNLGLSGEEGAKLVGTFARLNGGSTNVANDMIVSVKETAKLAGVIPNKVMADLANNADAFALHSRDGGKAISEAAIYAARLGSSLDTLAATADNLLDFESSITKELELGAMLGRNINLNEARRLAYTGDLEGMQRELLNQLGGIEEFNKMDYFQKKATADLMGVSVGQLKTMLENSEKATEEVSLTTKQFSAMNEMIDAVANTAGGTLLKSLSAGIVLVGQMGDGFKTIGDGAKSAFKLVGGLFNKVSDVAQIPGVGDSITDKLKDAASEKIADAVPGVGESITDKLKDTAGEKIEGVVDDKISSVTSTEGISDTVESVNADKSMGDKLKDLAKGLKQMGDTKVLKGALNLIPTALGLGLMIVGIPSLIAISTFGVPAGAGLTALGKGLKSLGNAGVAALKGIALFALFGAALIPLTYALSLLAPLVESIGKGIGIMVESIGKGIATVVGSISELIVNILPLFSIEAAAGVLAMAGAFTALATSLLILGSLGSAAIPVLLAVGVVGLAAGSLFGGGEGGDETTDRTGELIDEIKGLRSDLNSGKIAVYVDGRKVTSSVSRVVDKVSTNSYGL